MIDGQSMSGRQLYDAINSAARQAGVTTTKFVRPLSNWPENFLSQLQQASVPKSLTVQRVAALIAGEPIPPGRGKLPGVSTCTRAQREELGLHPSGRQLRDARSLDLHTKQRTALERARDLAELAHATRRPGQTLADRVRELQREMAT